IVVGEGDPSPVWKSVVTRGWAPIAVTLCAAAIRTAVSLQAGVAVSMMASIVLEQHRVRLGDSAFLSIIRAVSIQPVKMLFSLGRGAIRSLGFVGIALIAMMSVTALASAFTSSILLSDFGNIAILGLPSISMVGYGNDTFAIMDVWRSPPVQYPRFAEFTNGSRVTGDHLDDTGFVLRAPVPMANSGERESLRAYKGPAVVFDDRVICVAPRNLSFLNINQTRSSRRFGRSVGFAIGGSAVFDRGSKLPLPLKGDDGEEPWKVPFFCHVPDTFPSIGLTSNITICAVEAGLVSDNTTTSPLWLKPALPRLRLFKTRLPIFLIFKFTTTAGNRIEFEEFWNKDNASFATKRGPWHQTEIQGVAGLEAVTISVTACVASNVRLTYNVTMTSPSDGQEPDLGWQGKLHTSQSDIKSPESFRYDTADVRRQLSVTEESPTLSPQQRGIMNLEVGEIDWARPLNSGIEFAYAPQEFFPVLAAAKCDSIQLQCVTDPSAIMSPRPYIEGGHPVHVALFTDTLADTGSPAKAMQAWLNVMMRQKFYDSMGRFTAGAEAECAQSIQVFAPQQWGGMALRG
ncbi:hypothetical protein QBC34DRAFT_312914, partial [Podospora aff. communis PSN243]